MSLANNRQDLIVYSVLGLSFIGLLAFRGQDLVNGIADQTLASANARKMAKDTQIAEMRVNKGCSTGFVLPDGNPNLTNGSGALDIETKTPLSPGTVLCDRTGATAIVSAAGVISDVRVSARLRKLYMEQGFREENLRLMGGQPNVEAP